MGGTDICILFGVFGLVTIGTFELDSNNKIQGYMHYVGVTLTVGLFLGFNWQMLRVVYTHDTLNQCPKGWAAFVCGILDISAFLGLCCWLISLWKTGKYQKYLKENKEAVHDRKIISRHSILNLGFEAVYLLAAGLSLCAWMFVYPVSKSCRLDNSVCCTTW